MCGAVIQNPAYCVEYNSDDETEMEYPRYRRSENRRYSRNGGRRSTGYEYPRYSHRPENRRYSSSGKNTKGYEYPKYSKLGY